MLCSQARDIYEEAIQTVVTVRDFTQVFDAYAQFEKGSIASRMETMEGVGSTDDGDDDHVDSLTLHTHANHSLSLLSGGLRKPCQCLPYGPDDDLVEYVEDGVGVREEFHSSFLYVCEHIVAAQAIAVIGRLSFVGMTGTSVCFDMTKTFMYLDIVGTFMCFRSDWNICVF